MEGETIVQRVKAVWFWYLKMEGMAQEVLEVQVRSQVWGIWAEAS